MQSTKILGIRILLFAISFFLLFFSDESEGFITYFKPNELVTLNTNGFRDYGDNNHYERQAFLNKFDTANATVPINVQATPISAALMGPRTVRVEDWVFSSSHAYSMVVTNQQDLNQQTLNFTANAVHQGMTLVHQIH